jgi:tripartite-type tricarboxylate transporter receptor subunit TctC
MKTKGDEMKTITKLIAVGMLATLGLSAQAQAQSFPTRPITFVVPFAAGGPTDMLGRTLAAKLTEVIGEKVVVENRPGAGGSIAAQYVKKAAPDGYTIMVVTTGTQTINPFVFPKIGYDSLTDFTYITTIGNYELVLVVTEKSPFNSLNDLIKFGRENPDRVTFGSGGVGTTSHLAGELFTKSQGIRAQHVPYKGSAAALNDVIAGNVTMVFDLVSTGRPAVEGGRAKALGVSGPKRAALLPNIQTMAEQGITGFDVTGWMGVAGPAGIPKPVVDKLHKAIAESVASPDFQERLRQQAFEASIISPEAYLELVKSDMGKWSKAVKESGASAN